jgi:hypothetical protein
VGTGVSVLVVLLRVNVLDHGELGMEGGMQGLSVLMMGLAWPHASTGLGAGVMSAPFIAFLGWGIWGKLTPVTSRDREVAGFGVWALLIVGGMAVARGGGTEMQAGIPSRYADFLVVLSVVNIWAVLRWIDLLP